MKYLFQRYAQWFNKKYQRKGHVFCGIYRAALCQDNDYLIVISLYIHLNPLKAKLAKNVFSYKWFSLRVYLDSSKKSFINTEYILSIMGDKKRSRKIYRDLVNDMARSKFKFENVIENKSAIENFTHTLAHYFKKNNQNTLWNNVPFFKSIFQQDSAVKEIGKVRRRVGYDEKKAFVYFIDQMKASGYTYKEIAERLRVNRATIYRILH
jgi:putative transposase